MSYSAVSNHCLGVIVLLLTGCNTQEAIPENVAIKLMAGSQTPSIYRINCEAIVGIGFGVDFDFEPITIEGIVLLANESEYYSLLSLSAEGRTISKRFSETRLGATHDFDFLPLAEASWSCSRPAEDATTTGLRTDPLGPVGIISSKGVNLREQAAYLLFAEPNPTINEEGTTLKFTWNELSPEFEKALLGQYGMPGWFRSSAGVQSVELGIDKEAMLPTFFEVSLDNDLKISVNYTYIEFNETDFLAERKRISPTADDQQEAVCGCKLGR